MEDIVKVTIDELKNQNIEINKKFLLIDSSLYTDEAYEYLLSLVDKTESVAFISDRKLIYTQGDYFGGDIWKESLAYFGNLILTDPITGEEITTVQAQYMNDRLKLTSDGTIKIEASEEISGGLSLKTIKFSFDLEHSVDTNKIELSGGQRISLNYGDGKLKLYSYVPISIKNEDPDLIELDTDISEIRIPLLIEGNNGVRNISVYTSPVQDCVIEDNVLISPISFNMDQYFNISINDGETYDVKTIIQRFGYGLFYSTTEINNQNYLSCSRILRSTGVNCEFTLIQGEGVYGYFACPSSYNPVFKDENSGFIGGWKKIRNLELYSNRKLYTLYRTENSGLGKVKWSISEIKY